MPSIRSTLNMSQCQGEKANDTIITNNASSILPERMAIGDITATGNNQHTEVRKPIKPEQQQETISQAQQRLESALFVPMDHLTMEQIAPIRNCNFKLDDLHIHCFMTILAQRNPHGVYE